MEGIYHRSYQPARALVIVRALGVTPNLWVKFLCRDAYGRFCTASFPERDSWYEIINRWPQKCSSSDIKPWMSAEANRASERAWTVLTDRNFDNNLELLSPKLQFEVLKELRSLLVDEELLPEKYRRFFLPAREMVPFSFEWRPFIG
jgi:hypothetical protein